MSIQLEHSHNRAATPSHLHSTCLSPLHCHLIRHPDFTSLDSMAVTHPRPIKWQLEYLNQCSYMPVGDTCHYPTSILPVHCHEHSHTPFTSISAQCRLNSTLSILADTLALQFLGHSTFRPSSIQGPGGHPFLY